VAVDTEAGTESVTEEDAGVDGTRDGSLGHSTGHCLTGFHELCPRVVARSMRAATGVLSCTCTCHEAAAA